MPNRLSAGLMGPDETKTFFKKYRKWEKDVKDAYLQNPLIRDENYLNVTSKSINLRAMLSGIPMEDRDRLMGEYQNMIRWSEFGPTDPANLPEYAKFLRDDKKNKALRFLVDPDELKGEGANPVSIIYNRLFPNLNQSNADAGYKLGMNIPSADYLEHVVHNARSGTPIPIGAKVLIFDTETAGLTSSSGVRQVAAKMVHATDAGMQVQGGMFNTYFDVARMHLGYLADDAGRAVPMTDVLQSRMGVEIKGQMGYGSDFANEMKPFLQSVIDADYIAGHNVDFDISQIFEGLATTGAYKDNTEGFRHLLDKARGILDKKGAVIDTRDMASRLLPDLDIDPMLQQFDYVGGPHSLSNLMLQTDLYERLKRDVPDIDVKLGIQSGIKKQSMMHAGEVDTEIEAHLFKYLQEDSLAKRADSKLELTDAAHFLEVRRGVFKSFAPTPITKISDPTFIDKRLLSILEQEEGGVKHITEAGKIIYGKPPVGVGNILASQYNITPLEQEMWATRRFGTTAETVSDDQLIRGLGDWRRYTLQNVPYQGWLNKAGTLFKRGEPPSREGFAHLQSMLEKKGVPFAGLSRPERELTTGLAQASRYESAVNELISQSASEKRLVELGDVFGISRFALWDRAYISEGIGRNISLPTEFLQEAEKAGILSTNLAGAKLGPAADIDMLGVSAFESREGNKFVNLTYRFKSEEEAQRLAEWLSGIDIDDLAFGEGTKSLRDLGFKSVKDLNAIVENVAGSGFEHGIGIAKLDSKAGEAGYDVISDFTADILRDEQMTMRAGLIGIEGGVAKVGAFVMDRLGTAGTTEAQRMADYARDLKLAATKERQLGEALKNPAKAAAAKAMYYAPERAMKTVDATLNVWNKIRGQHHYAGIGAAVGIAAIATGWYRHHKKTEAGNETMKPMPIQTSSDYYNYRKELNLPPAPARRMPDPLLTAGVTGNLDRNKVNHAMMGNGKYNNLYGGVI